MEICRLYDQLHCPESPNHPRVSDSKRAFVGTYPAPPSIMTPHFTRRPFIADAYVVKEAMQTFLHS